MQVEKFRILCHAEQDAKNRGQGDVGMKIVVDEVIEILKRDIRKGSLI
jgi:hypothetical protein